MKRSLGSGYELETSLEDSLDVIRQQSVSAILTARADNWPQAYTPISQFMISLLRFSKLMIESTAAKCAAHGLTYAEFEVLAALRSAPAPHELIPTTIAGGVLISSGGLTKVLRGLEAKNLVVRGSGATDRRSKPARLTDAGKEMAERVMGELLGADAGMVVASGFADTAELDRTTKLLRQLLEVFETAHPDKPD